MYLLKLFLKKIYWERFSWEMLSKQLGDGYDLEDFREYQIWDNVKKINWKLSAKYDKEYVSVYKQEKEPILDIFLDVDYNFDFFKDRLNSLLKILELELKQLGIKKNIFVFENNKLVKKENFQISFKNKKSNLGKIFSSREFDNKHYKILVSDFLFYDDFKMLTKYNWKLFFSYLPVNEVLKWNSFPILNGYFDSFFCNDFIKNYNDKLLELKKYWEVEKV